MNDYPECMYMEFSLSPKPLDYPEEYMEDDSPQSPDPCGISVDDPVDSEASEEEAEEEMRKKKESPQPYPDPWNDDAVIEQFLQAHRRIQEMKELRERDPWSLYSEQLARNFQGSPVGSEAGSVDIDEFEAQFIYEKNMKHEAFMRMLRMKERMKKEMNDLRNQDRSSKYIQGLIAKRQKVLDAEAKRKEEEERRKEEERERMKQELERRKEEEERMNEERERIEEAENILKHLQFVFPLRSPPPTPGDADGEDRLKAVLELIEMRAVAMAKQKAACGSPGLYAVQLKEI